jgi:hypothetical protein
LSDRPAATVTVIRLAEGVLRVEVLCPFSGTAVTSTSGRCGLGVREQVLTTTALRQHGARCGRCDSEGNEPQFMRWTDRTWDDFLTMACQRSAPEVRVS